MSGIEIAKGEGVAKMTGQRTGACRNTDISHIAKAVHKNAVAHGWWDRPRGIPELLVLIHSEVSEALEADRNNDHANFAEELADIVIRVFDMAEGLGVDIQTEILKKHEINKDRPYRHGGKKY